MHSRFSFLFDLYAAQHFLCGTSQLLHQLAGFLASGRYLLSISIKEIHLTLEVFIT